MASLELTRLDRKEVFEKYIITGTFLYQFVPDKKVVLVHDLPKPPPGQVSDNNLVSLIFGMKAAQAKQRYDLQYKGYDNHYLYVEIAPKQTQDKRDFARARLVLLRSNYMPRQLWFQEPNGNEITWDFPRLTTPAKLTVLEFQRPELPPGWQFQRMNQSGQPRVMRNQE
jgi:TIGR03009 family protein